MTGLRVWQESLSAPRKVSTCPWRKARCSNAGVCSVAIPIQFNIQHSPVVYHLHPSNHEIFGIDGKYLEMLVPHIFTRPQAGNTPPPPGTSAPLHSPDLCQYTWRVAHEKHKLCGSGCHGMGRPCQQNLHNRIAMLLCAVAALPSMIYWKQILWMMYLSCMFRT